MAGRPAQPGGQPQYSLPKLAPEEQFVQKKQGEYIQNDVRQLSIHMDVETSFRDVKDAITRLLPFHLFNSVDAAELDLDDTPDHAGANLMSNRHEAWQELCVAKANDLRRKADKSATTIAAIGQQVDSEVLSGSRPLDRLAIVKLQQEDLKRKIAVEKAELQKLVVIAQPVAPQPAVVQAAPPAAAAPAMAAKAPMAAAGMQQPAVQGSLSMQQIQQIQHAQILQRQQLIQQIQQQQLQGALQPAQVQQFMLLQQQQQQQQQAALQQQQLLLLQAARKQ